MMRKNNVPFNPPAVPMGAPAPHKQQLGRVPRGFQEAMKHISEKVAENSNSTETDTAATTQPAKPSCGGWRSSFKPLGDDDNSQEKGARSPDGVELYNPYEPGSSDSEHETPRRQEHNNSQPDQESDLDGQCWSRGLSPGHRHSDRWADTDNRRPLDHRVCSPDRPIHGSSTQQFSPSYGGQRTNGEERMTASEYRRERTTAVRLSPSRARQDYMQNSEYMETEMDDITPSTEVTRNRRNNIRMDKTPITCDLCDVELSNSQELKDHLENKSHWDTLEHIQQQNNYDDMAIAFLQEIMLCKSRKCSRAIEDSALQALQENDHMTRIEMFHCAACKVFVSTSASSVQTHITSQEHLFNTREFEVQQSRACLDTAETMMRGLNPQFEQFLKGNSPFE